MAKQDLSRNINNKPIQKKPTESEIMVPALKNALARTSLYKCTVHGEYSANADLFPKSYSFLYAGNDYRLPVCKDCLNKIYDKYLTESKDEYESIRHICMLYDIYYDKNVVEMAIKNAKPDAVITYYISKISAVKYKSMTYWSTILQEREERIAEEKLKKPLECEEVEISEETKRFWGYGFTASDYTYLDSEYDDWLKSYPNQITSKAMETVIKKICLLDLQAYKGVQKNEKVDQVFQQFRGMLDAAGLQPKQSADAALTDNDTFGTKIKQWEKEKPISEPQPHWRDVDKIHAYITAFYYGHLAKMHGFKNDCQELYDEVMAKYTVKKPDYTDSEVGLVSFEDVFGSGDNDA